MFEAMAVWAADLLKLQMLTGVRELTCKGGSGEELQCNTTFCQQSRKWKKTQPCDQLLPPLLAGQLSLYLCSHVSQFYQVL